MPKAFLVKKSRFLHTNPTHTEHRHRPFGGSSRVNPGLAQGATGSPKTTRVNSSLSDLPAETDAGQKLAGHPLTMTLENSDRLGSVIKEELPQFPNSFSRLPDGIHPELPAGTHRGLKPGLCSPRTPAEPRPFVPARLHLKVPAGLNSDLPSEFRLDSNHERSCTRTPPTSSFVKRSFEGPSQTSAPLPSSPLLTGSLSPTQLGHNIHHWDQGHASVPLSSSTPKNPSPISRLSFLRTSSSPHSDISASGRTFGDLKLQLLFNWLFDLINTY